MNIKPKAESKKKKREKRPPKKITETYLHNSGLYYLQRFAASSAQFRKVMMRKVYKSCRHHTDQDEEACAAMVDEVIGKFQQAGLLNDDLYARGSVFSLRRQGKSKRAITAKLSQKGVDEDLIEEKLHAHAQESHTEDAEFEAALIHARKKKLGPYRRDEEYDAQKELASLARAGFSYDVARRVLDSQKS